MNAPSLHQKMDFLIRMVFLVAGDFMPHPPRCLDSFKYSARICRMAMRFVRARLEKHLRVPFLHTL
jgi:hypothetical protein